MKKLTPQQLDRLHGLLIRNGSNDQLMQELLDHLACEVETYLWQGYNFELALEKVAQEANSKALQYLRDTYQKDLTLSDEQLQRASLDDIVFQFRNKAYGAYDLRQSYPLALRNALIFGIGLFLMMISLLSGIMVRQWSFLSVEGILWLVGLSAVAFASWNWFVQSQKRKHLSF